MGLKINGNTIAQLQGTEHKLEYNSEPISVNLFELADKTSNYFTHATFSTNQKFTTFDFEKNLTSVDWTIVNNYTAEYDDGKVAFTLQRVTSGSLYYLNIKDITIDFTQINSKRIISVPISDVSDSNDDSIYSVQVIIGYDEKKKMYICLENYISTEVYERTFATEYWTGKITWRENKLEIVQDTIMNSNASIAGDLTVSGRIYVEEL